MTTLKWIVISLLNFCSYCKRNLDWYMLFIVVFYTNKYSLFDIRLNDNIFFSKSIQEINF